MTKRLNWLSIVDIVVPPHNRSRDMLAAPSPTSVVASCHAAACGAALTTLKSLRSLGSLKTLKSLMTFSQITENEKRRTGSALYVSTGRGKPNQQYNTKPAPAKGSTTGLRDFRMEIARASPTGRRQDAKLRACRILLFAADYKFPRSY